MGSFVLIMSGIGGTLISEQGPSGSFIQGSLVGIGILIILELYLGAGHVFVVTIDFVTYMHKNLC